VSDTPKGQLATVSVGDTFECHVRLGEVKFATFANKEGASGKQLYIVRLLDEDSGPLLSIILHTGADGYEEGAVEFWTKVRARFRVYTCIHLV